MANHNQQLVRHKHDKIYEQLAKPGKKCSVYNNHYLGEVILDEYQVEQIFQDKSSGFYALGLVSVSGENNPVLVIRGFGTWGSLREFPIDFFPYKDIPDVFITQSDQHLQAAKKVGVDQWLHAKAKLGRKPDVVGQSLGGKVGQQLAIEVPNAIHSLVTFNSIGISAQDCTKYQGQVEIFHYINPVDLVPQILGEKFLPGTIVLVFDSSIKRADLLGQHNKLVLDNPETLVKAIETRPFYLVRELYQSVRSYGVTVQKQVETLNQLTKQELARNQATLAGYEQTIYKKFEASERIFQLAFSQIKSVIQQELLEMTESTNAAINRQVNDSVEVIQNEVESLRKAVGQGIGDSRMFDCTQTLEQELQNAVGAIKQQINQFLVEAALTKEGLQK